MDCSIEIAAIQACAELGFSQLLSDGFPNQLHVLFIRCVIAWSDINIGLKLAPEGTQWFEREGLKSMLTAKEFITKVNTIHDRLIDPKCPVCSSPIKLTDVIQGDLCCNECTTFFERAAKAKANYKCLKGNTCVIVNTSLERLNPDESMQTVEEVNHPSHGVYSPEHFETEFMTPGGYRVRGPRPSALDPTQSADSWKYSTVMQQASEAIKKRFSQKIVST
ncbi:hypothetical protein CAEBREN_05921 [Caenorhabditis brenneri]|uniref:Nuclear receptor domain-containing protein n=1 Tax=Caenorhabditis brenneri TaxID=135651 RepID=G0MYE1_CAEBE|nr:hypothetical protein CAEBREN_05921 [Caenorhabditis brenneri]